MYRPDDWEGIKARLFTDDILNQDDFLDRLSEAVADAILKALMEEGKYIDASKFPYGMVLNEVPPIQKLTREFKGYIILIPDEG